MHEISLLIGELAIRRTNLTLIVRLGTIKILSVQLQSTSATLGDSYGLVMAVVEQFEMIDPPTEDPRFDEIWAKATHMVTKCDLLPPPPRRVRRVRREAAAIAGREDHVRNFEGPQDWRRHVFNPMLRALVVELNQRFCVDNVPVLLGIDALKPT